MTGISPTRDFDWLAVSWGGPDEVVTGECSYCDAPLGEEEMPLILWNDAGWAARFCTVCQQRYWGLKGEEICAYCGYRGDDCCDAPPAAECEKALWREAD
jgi:hypothetical protein